MESTSRRTPAETRTKLGLFAVVGLANAPLTVPRHAQPTRRGVGRPGAHLRQLRRAPSL